MTEMSSSVRPRISDIVPRSVLPFTDHAARNSCAVWCILERRIGRVSIFKIMNDGGPSARIEEAGETLGQDNGLRFVYKDAFRASVLKRFGRSPK